MNVAILRKLDAGLGLPAAWVLGLFPRASRTAPTAPRTVVFVKLFGLGSIVATAGVIREFRERVPGCRTILVTFAAQTQLGPLLGVFDEILGVRSHSPAVMFGDAWRAWRRLRQVRPDLAVDIEYFSKLSTVLCACIGARYRLGFLLPARWRQRLVDGGIAFREDVHFTECVARLLAPWHVDYRKPRQTVVRIDADSTRRASELLAGAAEGGTSPARWVLLNPNAHTLCVERRWPPERFGALIGRLAAENGDLHFALLGTQAEREVCATVLSHVPEAALPRCRNLAGTTGLSTAAALLAHAALFVTNDSGLMHLGAAVGTPIVALFGPESPLRYRPLLSDDRLRILQGDVPCGPCLTYMNHKRAPCGGRNRCMQAIPVEAAVEACRELLTAR